MDKDINEKVYENYACPITITDSRLRKIYTYLKTKKTGTLLELGCGSGEFLNVFAKKGWKVMGGDISKKAVEIAKTKYKLNVKYCNINSTLPFKKDSFDVIIAGELIEHSINDLEFINKVYNLLKKEGYFIFTTPNLVSLKNRIIMLFGYEPRYAVASFHYHVYTKDLLTSLIKESNFSKFEIRGNFIIYSKNRERFMGSVFEKMADKLPSLSEHFIVIAKK